MNLQSLKIRLRASHNAKFTLLTECEGTKETRERVMESFVANLNVMNNNSLPLTQEILQDKPILTQFILDCSSMNLPNNLRVNINDRTITDVIWAARDFCYAIHNERMRQLKEL